MDHAVVRAVARDQPRGLEARIDGELVQRVEAVGRLLAAERREVFAGLVEAVNVIARVAIGHVDVAVGRHVEAGKQEREAIAACVANLELIGIDADPIVMTMAPSSVIFTIVWPRSVAP
jgi:hypothetical protein